MSDASTSNDATNFSRSCGHKFVSEWPGSTHDGESAWNGVFFFHDGRTFLNYCQLCEKQRLTTYGLELRKRGLLVQVNSEWKHFSKAYETTGI